MNIRLGRSRHRADFWACLQTSYVRGVEQANKQFDFRLNDLARNFGHRYAIWKINHGGLLQRLLRLEPEGKLRFLPAHFYDIIVLMAKQETLVSHKRRGPAPTGKGTPILTRLQPDLLEKLDAYVSRQTDEISRPEAIRRLVELGLKFPRSKSL